MTDFLESIVPYLHNLGAWGHWFVLLITFGESFVITGMFVPGTFTMVIMGGLIPSGYYEFKVLLIFAIIGAILGDGVSYELGRLGKTKVANLPFVSRYFSAGKSFFIRHQGKSVIMGRFIGPIRPIIPFVAGVMEMKRGQFYAYNVASAIGWSFSYLTLGYVCGYAWKEALMWSSTAIAILIGSFLLGAAALSVWRWYKLRTIRPSSLPL